MKNQKYKAIYSETLSSLSRNSRFVIINPDTGKILDDAQGYGYKTIQKAYAAYSYKNRDKTKDKEHEKKFRKIKKWMKEHNDFVEAMNQYSLEIAKGSWGSEEKFNAKFVKEMLKQNNLETDFTAGDLLKVWQKKKLTT